MKICPQCNQTYSDETLNFCLEDGSALNQASSAAPPPTVIVPVPRESVGGQRMPTVAMLNEVRTEPRYDVPQQKRSRPWIWVLVTLAAVMVLCGGGFIGLVLLVPVDEETPPEEPKTEQNRSENRTDGDSNGDPSRRLEKDDKLADWQVNENKYISSEVRDGALVLTSIDKYYYVILSEGFETYDASTLLTVKNLSGGKASSGFGLVIHSYPTSVLDRGYSFLIRSDDGTYRIVQHTNKKERVHVKWTKSKAILRGKAENDLEVRVDGNEMEFFINGESVDKLKDYTNYKDGIAGIYTSDEIPIAFSKLELRK